MRPKRLVMSTTYKTLVALENPCKKRSGIVIGQLEDRASSRAWASARCAVTVDCPSADASTTRLRGLDCRQ